MHLQRWNMRVGRGLTFGQQRANLSEQVIANPCQHLLFDPPQLSYAFPRALIRDKVSHLTLESDCVPVNRDLLTLVREKAWVLPAAAGLDSTFNVEGRLSAPIGNDEPWLSSPFASSRAQHNIIPVSLPAELPGGFEQLEELANDIPFRRICNHADHRRTLSLSLFIFLAEQAYSKPGARKMR